MTEERVWLVVKAASFNIKLINSGVSSGLIDLLSPISVIIS